MANTSLTPDEMKAAKQLYDEFKEHFRFEFSRLIDGIDELVFLNEDSSAQDKAYNHGAQAFKKELLKQLEEWDEA